jgi:hypothetical protein
MQEKYNFCEWDEEMFKLPDEYLLDENCDLAEALNVFYLAGGYDFFNVIKAECYSGNWLDFVGNLYTEIEDGKYHSRGQEYTIPLNSLQKQELLDRGVPEVFLTDL